jgi:hypothetical protein
MFKHARVLDHVNFEGLKGYHPDAPPPDPSTPAIVSFEFQPSGDGNGMKLMLRNDAGHRPQIRRQHVCSHSGRSGIGAYLHVSNSSGNDGR